MTIANPSSKKLFQANEPFNELQHIQNLGNTVNDCQIQNLDLEYNIRTLGKMKNISINDNVLTEAKYSNLIEGIDCREQDKVLADLIIKIISKPFYYDSQHLTKLQDFLLQHDKNQIKKGIRDEICRTTRLKQGQKIIYTPPKGMELIKNLLCAWNQFHQTHNDITLTNLLTFSHYQFESIHPLYDMNGRIGRALMAGLYCQLTDKTHIPVISEELYRRRGEYYSNLNEPRITGDFNKAKLFFNDILTTSTRKEIIRSK